MIIPIRCFTCNQVIANKWVRYEELIQNGCSHGDAFVKLKVKRYCCKRMLLSHVDLIEKVMDYSDYEINEK